MDETTDDQRTCPGCELLCCEDSSPECDGLSDSDERGPLGGFGDGEPRMWRHLGAQCQDDLRTWYNTRELDYSDKLKLATLYGSGGFEAWDCPECKERVYRADPPGGDWSDFQGVCQVDYTSYPGNVEKYQESYLERMCDDCRRGT